MSQKAEILQMLRTAGETGVRSDVFYRKYLGRGVARIYDLKTQDGYEISSEREGKFVRYRLLVGSSAEGRDQAGLTSPRPVNAASGVASSEELIHEPRSVPSMFDADDCLQWGS